MHVNIYKVNILNILNKKINVYLIVYFHEEENIGGKEDKILLYHVNSFTNTHFDFNCKEEKR